MSIDSVKTGAWTRLHQLSDWFFFFKGGKPKNVRERWTPAEDRRLTTLASQGQTPRQVAKMLSRSEDGIRARAQRLGVRFTPNKRR